MCACVHVVGLGTRQGWQIGISTFVKGDEFSPPEKSVPDAPIPHYLCQFSGDYMCGIYMYQLYQFYKKLCSHICPTNADYRHSFHVIFLVLFRIFMKTIICGKLLLGWLVFKFLNTEEGLGWPIILLLCSINGISRVYNLVQISINITLYFLSLSWKTFCYVGPL